MSTIIRFVYLYFVFFVFIDISLGFFLKYLNMQHLIPLHPGQVIRLILLLLLFISLIKDQYKNLNIENAMVFFVSWYLFLLAIILGSKMGSLSGIVIELYNYSKLILVILLAHFVRVHWGYFFYKFDKIFNVNFLFLTFNLFFSYTTGIGLDTYHAGDSTKGFFYAGNAVSVLSLVFFSYYLFSLGNNKWNKIYLALSIFNIYIVGTKVIFLIPLITIVYLLFRVNWSALKLLTTSLIIIPITVYVSYKLYPFVKYIFNNRYLSNLTRSGIVFDYNSDYIGKFLNEFRRVSYSITQVQYQFNDIGKLLFGVGESGQQKFWSGSPFNFAAMDFFDIMFQYGLIATIALYVYILKGLKSSKIRNISSPIFISFLLIFAYSFFGGYVIYTTTSGTLFALLLGLYPKSNLMENKLKSSNLQ